MWIGTISKYDSACACSSAVYLLNQMEGPTFENNFPLGANFLYDLFALRQLNCTGQAQKELLTHVNKNLFQNFVLSLVDRLWRILRRSWAVTGHATCSCKQQFPPAFNRHRRISCKAPAFTSRLQLCGEGAKHHFKIHIFYS